MVEKIIINPDKVRGYGNIMSPHSSGDYSLEDCTIATGTDTVNGATETVYTLTPETTSIYSIAFDSSSYTTSDGSVTCYVTLLNNSVAVSGASISLTGTGSTLSATTNSSGVATFNLTGISADCTITATYSNVSDTATITVQTGPLFYDPCTSSSGLTNYGQIVPISSSTTTSYLEYNSTQNAYYVHANGDWGVIPITVLNGADDYKITGEFKTAGSSNTYQGGFGFRAQNTTDNIIFRMYGTSCNSVINDSNQQSIGNVSANSKWYKFEVTKEGQDFEITVTDVDTGTTVGTLSRSTSFDTYYVGFMTVAGQSAGSYVRNVKAEAI